jgi:hypothetical protein
MPVTIHFATLKYDPKEPESKNGYTPQHSTVIVFDDQEEERIYFNLGLFSYLKRGDTIAVELSKGKWKPLLPEKQAPELIRTLKERQGTTPTAPPPLTPHPSSLSDIQEIAAIAQELAELLPEWDYTALATLAQSVFA